jgi:hypothetical protein
MELVGVELPADATTMRDTAQVFAEEFARMGYDEAALMALFQNPKYVGAHRALQALGADTVQSIVSEHVQFWGRIHVRVIDAPVITPTPNDRAVDEAHEVNTMKAKTDVLCADGRPCDG